MRLLNKEESSSNELRVEKATKIKKKMLDISELHLFGV